MSRRVKIPASAQVERRFRVVGEPKKDWPCEVVIYSGYSSHGYATDYRRTSHRWVELKYPDGECDRRQLSGKNLALADKIVAQVQGANYAE